MGGFSDHVSTFFAPEGTHMSHSFNSLKGIYIGDYIGDYYRGY